MKNGILMEFAHKNSLGQIQPPTDCIVIVGKKGCWPPLDRFAQLPLLYFKSIAMQQTVASPYLGVAHKVFWDIHRNIGQLLRIGYDIVLGFWQYFTL